MNQHSIIFKPDFHCELFVDNVFQAIAVGREDLKILGLSAGKYIFKCICTICDIVIEKEVNVPDDSKVEISFEDYLFQHPDCIKYQLDLAVFMDWFPKLGENWKDLDFVCGEPLWSNEYELDIPVNVVKGTKEGYVDVLGNEVLDYYYKIREYHEEGDYAYYKYGYANGLSNVIKPCVYDEVYLYDYQRMDRVLAHLGMTDKYHDDKMSRADWDKYVEFIKEHEDEYPFVLDHVTQINEPFSDGCAFLFLKDKLVKPSQKWGIINLKKRFETAIKYDHVHTGGQFAYFGKIAIDVDGKWGLFDFEKFAQIVECQYDFIDIRDDRYLRYYQNGLCGLMDAEGNKLTEAVFLQIKDLSDGLFRVKQGDKWGFIDENGQECVACIFDKVDDFNSGVAKYYEGESFGFINHKGDRLTAPIYTYSEILPNGQIEIKEDCKWGVINQDGTEYLPIEYDEIVTFNDVVIGIKKEEGRISLSSTDATFNCDDYMLLDAEHISIRCNDKWKLFHTSGKTVLADSFDGIDVLVPGKMLYFRIGGRYALYNLSEYKYIIAFVYDEIFFCDNDRIALSKNGKWGFMDVNGEELIPCKIDKIYNWFGHISNFDGVNINCDKYGNPVWGRMITLRMKS